MLDYSHDGLMVAAATVLALMAGFTGLSLTRGASALPVERRKLVVAMAAIALGGGIWAMHFVAMLGLELPVLFYYDAVITLISALTAILVTGLALLLVHFGPRTPVKITGAGLLVGIGIPAMHYIGMAGMELCRPVYTVAGVLAAGLASVALSVGAFWLAYGQREIRNILLGTAGFGVAVVTAHFLAMAGTGFVEDAQLTASGPLISNGVLAFGVTVVAFVLSGSFLLTGVTVAVPEEAGPAGPRPPPEPAPPPMPPAAPLPPVAAAPEPPPPPGGIGRVPYEKEGRTRFVPTADIAAIRAEGHYTVLYVGAEKLFCPWSISEAESRLSDPDLLRSHRSYIVNRRHVSGFERKKDTGVCYFETVPALAKAPVSRQRLSAVRDHLGL